MNQKNENNKKANENQSIKIIENNYDGNQNIINKSKIIDNESNPRKISSLRHRNSLSSLRISKNPI